MSKHRSGMRLAADALSTHRAAISALCRLRAFQTVRTLQMTPQTLDAFPDEMLLMTLLLSQFIDGQLALVPQASANQMVDIRGRVEIAMKLRDRLPINIEYGEPDEDEQ